MRVRRVSSARALANLAEVYRLLKIYGLADSVLLDLGFTVLVLGSFRAGMELFDPGS